MEMSSDEVRKQAEERRRKVLANAQSRLKKIADLAKPDSPKFPENGFVDFEVDCFVNQPSTSNGLPTGQNHCSPPLNGYTSTERARPNDPFLQSERTFEGSTVHETHNLRRPVLNGFPFNQNDNHNLNDPFNFMRNLTSQLPPGGANDMSALLSGMGSLFPPQQPLEPAIRPVPSIIVFLVLGMVTRVILQVSSLQFNVFTPFLCLAIPLGVMSWGRQQTPMSSFISTIFLFFVGNPRTQTVITNCLRLTTLLQNISSLFALYFFSFVITHTFFELSTITGDINHISSSQSLSDIA